MTIKSQVIHMMLIFVPASNGDAGNIPAELSYLSSLRNLDLINNNLTGSYFDATFALLQMNAGIIPSELSQLKRLQNLRLQFNYLRGFCYQ